MDIIKEREGEALVMKVSGRLDTATAPVLERELIPAVSAGKKVVLDLSGVGYISSAGLRTLLVGHKTAAGLGHSQRIRGASKDILDILTMTGFIGILDMER